MTNHELEVKVKEYISLRNEGEMWDFKRQWYDKEKGKAELLHDIICMANMVQDVDGLIIIGVDEENDYAICDVKNDINRKDTHEMVKFLRDKTFDGGIRPRVHVESIDVDGKTIDVIDVENSSDVPYYLSKSFQKVNAYHIYTRVGDSNTPANRSADRNIVEKLWKKHFGIDKTALQKLRVFLKDTDDWNSIDGQQSFYNLRFPEFRIETECDNNRNGYEYYCFSQINSRPSWYKVFLKYQETIIDETLGISLDGGRFFTVVPNSLFSYRNEFFYAYIDGTLQNDLNDFFLNMTIGTDYDSQLRWRECIPVFESKEEKVEFMEYLKRVEVKPDKRLEQLIPDQLQNGEEGQRYKVQYPMSIAIVKELEQFRKSKY